MRISNEALNMVGVTWKDYVDWCKRNKIPKNKISSKNRFFSEIKNDRIMKDLKKDKIIIKRKEVK